MTTYQYVRQRVFRCAYLDRANVDLGGSGGSHAGVLNARPVDAAALRELGIRQEGGAVVGC